jgi:uncharacterized protein (DUF1778 family)
MHATFFQAAGSERTSIMQSPNPAHSNTTINVRAPATVRDLIDRAAQLKHKTRTDFILEASTAAAEQVLLDQVVFRYSEEQMKAFDVLMSQPIVENTAIQQLLATQSPWEA